MYFFDRQDTEEDPFSKVIFYSVLIHYGIFYLLFGNPFLLLNRDKNDTSTGQNIEVRLLSFPQALEAVQKEGIPFPIPELGTDSSQEKLALSNNLLEKTHSAGGVVLTKIAPFKEWKGNIDATGDSELEKAEVLKADSPHEMPDLLEAADTAASNATKKVAQTLPPSMTGPEDCLLKVVGMVCPGGDIECIVAYKEFCASLPE